jgi:hypothetical protein
MGLFALPLPAGWTGKLTAMDGAELFSRGDASGMVLFLGTAAVKPQILEGIRKNFQTNHRLLRTAKARVGGGVEATAEIYEGKRRDGQTEIVRMVTVPAGTAIGFYMVACPETEWDRWKADFAVMEHGLLFATERSGGAFTALPKDVLK